ncbi:predicted protein [Lichtheimia corymbifera JMRC:FSU:9682]|uniref:ACB domain-containing protein n=1 Tax=Lichtheimia corymbifera JMRC:FSU:9682 TaxID=1263082 RepID=A0A068S9T9_9FUNG|nr:predicted protein [Lichtheimia corymbifera JMRC:FSU:9682]
MTVPPSHYSERYINQRYNKALQIVQHLPATSSFQPTREEKLQLYAYYKQVTHGDIDTARPGIFDMVGRAKWDAWKKLEGMERLEAKHRYTETLLRSATEAYKRNSGRETAEQIIHAFALMRQRPVGDEDDEETTTTTTTDDDNIMIQEDESSSVDEEERAYLRQVQAFSLPEAPPRPRRPISRQQQQQQRRSWYYTPSNSSTPTPDKLRSTHDVPLDTNPWAPPIPPVGSSLSHRMANDSSSSDDDDDDHVTSSSRQSRPKSRTISPRQQQRASLMGRLPAFQGSPAMSTSSSATATARNTQHLRSTSNRATPELSVISLGPVTKRALESLQAEVIALNGRIDDLRKELADRDQQRRTSAAPTPLPLSVQQSTQPRSTFQLPRRDGDDEDDEDDSWKWVIKASHLQKKKDDDDDDDNKGVGVFFFT